MLCADDKSQDQTHYCHCILGGIKVSMDVCVLNVRSEFYGDVKSTDFLTLFGKKKDDELFRMHR